MTPVHLQCALVSSSKSSGKFTQSVRAPIQHLLDFLRQDRRMTGSALGSDVNLATSPRLGYQSLLLQQFKQSKTDKQLYTSSPVL